jgi:xylulokinase
MTLTAVTRSAQTWSASATSLLRSAPPISARGAVLLPPETDWSKVSVRLAPDPRHHELYQGLFADFQAIYPATRDILHRLASIQHSFFELPHTA